jgi:hypothetical protein
MFPYVTLCSKTESCKFAKMRVPGNGFGATALVAFWCQRYIIVRLAVLLHARCPCSAAHVAAHVATTCRCALACGVGAPASSAPAAAGNRSRTGRAGHGGGGGVVVCGGRSVAACRWGYLALGSFLIAEQTDEVVQTPA